MSNSDNFSNLDQNFNNDELIENFFDKLEKELSSIELQEIINGISEEELKEKGFIGEKEIGVTIESRKGSRIENGLQFEKTITFCEKRGTNISEVKIESVQFLPDVQPGCVIAHWIIPSDKNDNDTRLLSSFCDEKYLAKANLTVKIEEKHVVFISKVKGKTVLFNSLPYVIQSDCDGYCTISISQDRMFVTADLFPAKGNGLPLSIEKVLQELSSNNVIAGINNAKLAEYIQKVRETNIELIQVVIAEGQPAIDGKNAEIEYFFPTEETLDDFRVLPDGRIDYRRKANIPIVHKGDLLAKIGLPQKGQDGFDVTGKILKAKSGELPILLPGENVTVSKDGNEFRSLSDGQVSLNGKIINVFQHYVVDGDVDYGTGNIDFNGNVTIKGNVLEGFEVKATGDITILKNVESANIISGRDLKVCGGIIGRNCNSRVYCGRDLYVYYLQNATIEIQRDIFVGNSCIQSNVFCNGKMYLKHLKGVIIGGTVNVLEGIEAKTIGSESGTKTEIIVGNDFLIQKTVVEFKKVLKLYTNNLHKIDSLLLPLMRHIKNKIAIGLEKKNRLAMVLEKRKQLTKNIEIMKWKLKDVESRVPVNVTAVIKVSDTIFPDVTIRINDRTKRVDVQQHHISIRFDQKNHDLEFGPY